MEDKLPFELEQKKILVKKDIESDLRYGCLPEERPIKEIIEYGIINLNKPDGPTSHQVSDYLQRILGIDKAGHSGTLDPKVTGVLPCTLGRATKVVQMLLTAGKEYVGTMHLHKEISEEKLLAVIKKFTGKIMQMPPIKSAVKRQLRPRTIYYAKILEINGQEVLFKMGCQAGTYVRKWVHDIGLDLGCGAHMSGLTRTKAGPFTRKSMVTLQDVEDALWYWKEKKNEKFIRHCIQPIEKGVEHLQKIWILDSAVDTICHGASLKIPGIAKLHHKIRKKDKVAIMTLKNELVAIGSAFTSSEFMNGNGRGIAIKTEKVFMKPNTYPKLPVTATRE